MKSPLQHLSTADLHELAKALRAGWLFPPFSTLAVQKYARAATAEIATELQRLCDEGTSSRTLARFIDILADERERARHIDDFIDLVWTGPEAPGIANLDTGVVVRDLFRSAAREVLVSGYAIYQGKEIFKALAEQMQEMPDLKVQMFLDVQRKWRDTSKDTEILRQFAHHFKTREWPGTRLPEVYYDPRSISSDKNQRSSLHAKCIVVDQSIAFLSSANFTRAAQVRNIEAGVLIRSRHFAQKLAYHFIALIDTRALLRVPGI